MGFKMWHIYTVEYQSVITKNKNTDGTAEEARHRHTSPYDLTCTVLKQCNSREGEQSGEKGRWEQGRLVGTKLHYLEASSSV